MLRTPLLVSRTRTRLHAASFGPELAHSPGARRRQVLVGGAVSTWRSQDLDVTTRSFTYSTDGRPISDHLPAKEGLYDPRHERSSCGVGLIVDPSGARTHTTVLQAVEAVQALSHRGAEEGGRGDGVGLLTQIPHLFFHRKLVSRNIAPLNRPTDLGVGVMFFPPQGAITQSARDEMKATVDRIVGEAGIEVLAWRRVPIGDYAVASSARSSTPDMQQLLMRRPESLAGNDDGFERLLYLTRKRIEKALAGQQFYSPSFSHRTIAYKGLVVADNFRNFYPDLNDSDFQSAISLFHQRYSTNTFPQWYTAQPFRMLAHNGEINTLQGNLNWMTMREETLSSPLFGEEFADLLPVVQEGGSDSAALDNVLEMLVQCGRSPMQALSMLVPEAYERNRVMSSELRAYYDYQRTLMEPWDGPAALCVTDGRYACAAMDRNGLRPLRYWVTDSGKVIIGSEVGIVGVPVESITERGRLGPGDMLAVDTFEGKVMRNQEIKEALCKSRPYSAWLHRSMQHVQPSTKGLSQSLSIDKLLGVLSPIETLARFGKEAAPMAQEAVDDRARLKKAFGYSKEDEELVLRPMADSAHEPIGSMGDDTPLAAFSKQPQLLYRYFKQRFAEVTNPPIDPLLERDAMSLNITFGRKGQLLEHNQHASHLLRFPSPIITEAQLEWLLYGSHGFKHETVNAVFPAADGPSGLKPALEKLCSEAEAAVDSGRSFVVLSDRGVDADHCAIPMLLAVGAVHHHLIRAGKRMKASIVVSSAEPREDHHMAALIGYGASLVHPYLAFETVAEIAHKTRLDDPEAQTVEAALWNYRSALQAGLLRILSKMGISTVDSYRGAQVFETIGLSKDVIDACFTGTYSAIDCVGLDAIAADALAFHRSGFEDPVTYKRGTALPRSGQYGQAKGGEFHAYNPLVFNKLRKAAEGDFAAYLKYSKELDGRPVTVLRDALAYRKAATPVPIEEVESVESIASRFCTQAVSHGSISRETHETLSHAARILGSKSNTGEGGEDSIRFKPYERDLAETDHAKFWHAKSWSPKKGDLGNSKIKQVASARFGVTPYYLVSADQLEIKMAQGSKPGEGGHIPGHKVNAEIAKNRHSPEGVTLISPPVHHDIYSVEDLKQLVYDLKRINDTAPVCVKLVSQLGVGTIATAVVKGDADIVQISGNDGGTGASPLSSIKNAGLPWELGLAETQQVLVKNNMRERCTLRVDGGLKNGRDVVIAALLGAEEYGFGTAALVALGCVMARKCHLNTCPVGIATQDPELRAKFTGKPENVVTFLLHTAEQVRQILAEMGYRSLDEIIGRSDLLEAADGAVFPKGVPDLSALLLPPESDAPLKSAERCARFSPPSHWVEGSMDFVELDEIVAATCTPYLEKAVAGATTPDEWGDIVDLQFPIKNSSRSVGARLSGAIARLTGDAGLQHGSITLRFHGVAGQSFGAFCNTGMHLVLRGEAHDGVGKSMFGGTISVSPQADNAEEGTTVVMGNTCLYGATGGSLFGAGRAGERFAVRNSGATAVVEGVGDHCCEYMTNGTVVVLGSTGRNFGAGMSGGRAFVLDTSDEFLDRYNSDMVAPQRVQRGSVLEGELRSLVEKHAFQTGSKRAAAVLKSWDDALEYFWVVLPNTSPLKANSQALMHVPNWTGVDRTHAFGPSKPFAFSFAEEGLP